MEGESGIIASFIDEFSLFGYPRTSNGRSSGVIRSIIDDLYS